MPFFNTAPGNVMKKWVILVLVLLGCLLLAMQYLMNKKAPGPVPPGTTAQGEPTGVPLPPSATGYGMPEMPLPPPADTLGDPNQLNLPDVVTAYKGACDGGSLAEMKATHNRYWGLRAKETPFNPDDTKKMYGFVADYIGCVAVARESPVLCNTLPPAKPPEKPEAAGRPEQQPPPMEKDGLRPNCRRKVNSVMFIAYVAGKSKNSDACRAVLAGWKPEILAKVSETEFCAAAAKGMDAVNDYMQKAVGKKKKKIVKKDERARQRFSSSESACEGNAECLNGVRLYNAIKSGDSSRCPPLLPRKEQGGKSPAGATKGADSFCEAAITKSAQSCEPIIKEMSKFYCAAMEKTKKKTGGFIGMSKAEIDNAIAQKKLQIAEEDRRKKESDKIGIEVNQNVRKILKKE